MTKKQVNQCHGDFLSISEFLVEIPDDLYNYEEDVLNNNFNILRMFVKFYRPLKGPTMMAKCIIKADEKYQLLLNQLDLSLASQYPNVVKMQQEKGGKVSAYSLRSWSIPAVISNKECYRSHVIKIKSKTSSYKSRLNHSFKKFCSNKTLPLLSAEVEPFSLTAL
jgi:hypothetical protein